MTRPTVGSITFGVWGKRARLSVWLFRDAGRTGLPGARNVAGSAGSRSGPARTVAPPLPQAAPRRGAMDRPARGRASTGAYRLSGRVAVRRHRLPALTLHDAGARNRPHHLLPPPRAGGGEAAAARSPGARHAAPSVGAGLPLTPPWPFFPPGGTQESWTPRRPPN